LSQEQWHSTTAAGEVAAFMEAEAAFMAEDFMVVEVVSMVVVAAFMAVDFMVEAEGFTAVAFMEADLPVAVFMVVASMVAVSTAEASMVVEDFTEVDFVVESLLDPVMVMVAGTMVAGTTITIIAGNPVSGMITDTGMNGTGISATDGRLRIDIQRIGDC
jgi:hypothetical protein